MVYGAFAGLSGVSTFVEFAYMSFTSQACLWELCEGEHMPYRNEQVKNDR
jgi:hypothetical protein